MGITTALNAATARKRQLAMIIPRPRLGASASWSSRSGSRRSVCNTLVYCVYSEPQEGDIQPPLLHRPRLAVNAGHLPRSLLNYAVGLDGGTHDRIR